MIHSKTMGLAAFAEALLYRRQVENISSNFFLSFLLSKERNLRHLNSSVIHANLKEGIVLPIHHLPLTVNTSSAVKDIYRLTAI